MKKSELRKIVKEEYSKILLESNNWMKFFTTFAMTDESGKKWKISKISKDGFTAINKNKEEKSFKWAVLNKWDIAESTNAKLYKSILTEGKLSVEDCIPGKKYLVGYRNHEFEAEFVKWKLYSNGPIMEWRKADAPKSQPWEAYLSDGRICVGSSADPFKIIKEI